ANRMAIVEIMEVLTYHNMVDVFGNVPYTEALGGFDNKTPVYDDQVAIYSDLQVRLGSAIATLTAGADDGSWGSEDLVYQGDVAMWKKFAATLKARLGMRLADVNPATAQSELSAAISAGMLEPGESMQLPWAGVTPHNNTIYSMFAGGRTDYGPSNTIVDWMNDLSDTRLPAYFTQVDTSSEVGVEKWAYVGIPYGEVTVAYSSVSHFSDATMDASFPATFACNAEVEFILAEAAARGMNLGSIGGTAQEHYEAGIAESHDFWGVTMQGSYLNHVDVAWDDARNKELIGTQKWLALYNRGMEGWCVWRSFDWPVLNVPPDLTYGDIPFRMPFPYNEPDLNGTNYTSAAAAIGGDDVRTLLFWDAVGGTATPSPGF
ncbi:MAG: SusD/RagB family nutrient-binding outer membrane lipoprotein, partial [Bacteroidales bacterium]|nr:SusD/RagB family nutrient-binding outer membrane lipoprotein [Bacteroidales bacterium]